MKKSCRTCIFFERERYLKRAGEKRLNRFTMIQCTAPLPPKPVVPLSATGFRWPQDEVFYTCAAYGQFCPAWVKQKETRK